MGQLHVPEPLPSRETDHFITEEGVEEKRLCTHRDTDSQRTSFMKIPCGSVVYGCFTRARTLAFTLGSAKFDGICYVLGFLLVAFIKER